MVLLLPKPPDQYHRRWADQYTQTLELEDRRIWSAIQALQIKANGAVATAIGVDGSSYTTVKIVSQQCWTIRQCGQAFSELANKPYHASGIGVATVIVAAPNHGQVTGATATFTLTTVGNGLTITAGVPYTITVLDANSYQITATGVSVSTATFGTSTIVAFYPTMFIRLDVIPTPVPTELVIRIDGGLNGLTRGMHPADKATAQTLIQGPTPFSFVIANSVWIPGSVFKGGHCYVAGSLIDCSGALNRMAKWMRTHAPCVAYLPLGGLYVENSTVRFPESSTVLGRGGRRTFFFLTDSTDGSGPAHVLGMGGGTTTLYPNEANVEWVGFTVYGNRPYQKYLSGRHAVDLGGDSDVLAPLSVSFTDVTIIGSAGYGMSFGGHNIHQDMFFDRLSIMFSDGDCIDSKNRLSTSNVTEVSRGVFAWHAMGDQGTNLKPIYTMGNNVAVTVSGLTTVTLTLNALDTGGGRAGETITITGAATFNSVNLNGTFNVLSGSGGSTITIDSGQVASASSAGGGAGMSYFLPNISLGDNVVDMRGYGWTVRDCYWEGELFQRNAFSQRGGEATTSAGLGAVGCTIENVRGFDFTPAWVAATDGPGRGFITLRGKQAIVRNVWFTCNGGVGISTNGDVDEPQVSDFYITGANIGIECACDYGVFTNGKLVNCLDRGVQVYGFDTVQDQVLDNDPLNGVTLGAAVVNVYAPNHGQISGQRVGFSGFVNANGLTLLPSNSKTYVMSVIDSDNYHVTAEAGSAATSTATYGGSNITVHYGATNHTATGNIFRDVVTSNSDPANTCIAWAVGYDGTTSEGRAAQTWINGCDDRGSRIARVDYGDETFWGSSNGRSLISNSVVDTIAAPGLQTDSWGDPIWSFEWFQNVLSVDFGNLRHYRQLRLEVLGVQTDDVTNPNLQVQFTDDGSVYDTDNNSYSRMGLGSSTSSFILMTGVVAATGCYAVMEINNFNQARQSLVDINGGMINSATGVTSASGFTALPHANFDITGGTASPGVNVVANVKINNVAVIGAPVDWITSNTVTAANVATAINAGTTEYAATSSGTTVFIHAQPGHDNDIDQEVEVTIGGNVTVSPTVTTLGGNPWQGLRLAFGTANVNFTAGKVYLYGRQ